MWRIGNEKQILSRKSYENLPRNRRITKNLFRRNRSSKTRKNWWIDYESREESYDCVSIADLNSELTEQSKFLVRCQRILRSWNSNVPDQASSFPSPRTMPSRDSGLPHDTQNCMGITGNVFRTTTCPRRTILSSLRELTEFGIILWMLPEVCSCSGYPTHAMLLIKEVWMVDSVDYLKTSESIGVHRFLDSELLDARIASALNKIITNPYFKKKVRLEEQKAQIEDRFLRGRQIAYMIYEYVRILGAHEAVLDSTDPFSVSLKGDNIHDFYQVGSSFVIYMWNAQRPLLLWVVFLVFVFARSICMSLRRSFPKTRRSHTQRTPPESRDLRRGRGTGEVRSTCGESRSDPLRIAKGHSLQEEGGVADLSEVDCDAIEEREGFWSMSGKMFIAFVSCPENNGMYRRAIIPNSFELHWRREANHNQLGQFGRGQYRLFREHWWT